MTKTTVIHLSKMTPEQIEAMKAGDPQYVWVGSEHPIAKQKKSKWAAPGDIATIIKDCKTRKISIHEAAALAADRYREAMQGNPALMRALPELRGKTLVCSCKPLCAHKWLSELANKSTESK